MNLRALRQRQAESQLLGRFEELARAVTGKPDARAEDGIQWVEALAQRLAVPPLSSYGFEKRNATELIEKAARSSSMKGNPLPLTHDELAQILEEAR
jgi:alcohol dehydrogenase class IV